MAKAKQLPSGSWRVQVSTGERDSNGKYKYISLTASTQKEAELAALEYQVKHKETAKNPTNITLAEAMEKYIESKSNVLSPSTIRGYDIIYRNNLKSLMQLKLNKLNNNIIQSAINDEALNHSPKTVRNINGLLSAVLNIYVPDLRLNIRLPQREKKIVTVLSDKQISVLLRAIENNPVEIPVLLAVWLGLRQSEICGLKFDCIDFEKSVLVIKQARVRNKDGDIVVKTTKTFSSTRKLKIPKFILEKIKNQIRENESEFVVNQKGTLIYKRFKRLLRENNLPHISFHDLRMMNASIMLK
ncbi:MAG: site-specific integrase, partial [Eubacterium sp.]|nr:site-specific integrase [Eubacterium sp.]